MNQYLIIAGSCHSAKTNKVYNSQDVVSADCFLEQHIPELIAGKFIQLVVEKPTKDELSVATKPEGELENGTTDPATQTEPDYTAMSYLELKDAATKKGLTFKANISTKSLIDLLTAKR